MSQPRTGQTGAVFRARPFIGVLIAFALSLTALITSPQTAQAADEITIPDANFKAVLNSAIAATTGTPRAADQAITAVDASMVTTIESYNDGTIGPVADFTGVAAFTNLTSVAVAHAGNTISLAPFAGTSIQSLTLIPIDGGATDFAGTISSDLSALGSMGSLSSLTLAYYSLPDAKLRTLPDVPSLRSLTAQFAGITDISPLAGLKSLTTIDVQGNKIRDLSPVAAVAGLQQLTAGNNLVSDIGFLTEMKSLTGLVLSNNVIEDVSPLAQLTDKQDYRLYFGGQIDVSGNRAADLSPLAGFIGGPAVAGEGQSVYVGAYKDGGVPIKLRTWRGSAPSFVNPQDAGTYDSTANRLISTDPAAPFLDVIGDGSLVWKVHFSEDPDRLAAVRLNEVESDGDVVDGDVVDGDWIELYNPGDREVDVSGLVVADSDDTHQLVLPGGASIPAKGYRTIRTDDPAVAGQFGLGDVDSARIFAPGTTDLASATPIDAHTWASHATTTYGRTLPGAGRWATTSGGTFGTVNTFSSAAKVAVSGDAASTTGSATVTATVAKPGSTDVATDATGTVVFAVNGKDASGPVAVTNGTATWTATGLTGSPAGTAHQVTARYVAAGESDPYDSSGPSAQFTVTVTIGEFTGNVTLSTSTPQVCETITSDLSGITPAPDSVTYQWQRKNESAAKPWVDVAAGTGASHALQYTVVDGRVEAPVTTGRRLVATVSKTGYATRTVTSAETAGISTAPFSTKPAATLSTSTPKVGETITATHPKWTTCIPAEMDFEPGYEYQWLRDGKPIAEAKDSVKDGIGGAGPKKVSYVLTPADAGRKISLQITGNAPWTTYEKVDSVQTSEVTAGSFAMTPEPVIGGSAPTAGDTLTATVEAWAPSASLTWQWLRDGQPIDGATNASYTTTDADLGHAISVRVTGRADGYGTVSKASASTAQVKARPAPAAPAPGITQIEKAVSSAYSVKVTAQSGRKLRLSLSAKNVPASAIDRTVTLKIAGVKGSYRVTVKNGKATVTLGSKAEKLKKSAKVAVTVSLPKLTAKVTSTSGTTVTTTTYTVAKASKKTKVKLK